MDDATKKQIEDLEDALLITTRQYQTEVGEPRRMLLQIKELMGKFDWEAIEEPPELRQVLALVDKAASRF